jgi:HAD superfamily 5'-nucleotidase-like hydrolase
MDGVTFTHALERRIFCNRTLNLRGVAAVGFDMDYTLVHYDSEMWERRAYEHVRQRLVVDGFDVGHLRFDAQAFTLGLIIDRQLGNVVKANRFGFVKRACHGTRMLGFDETRAAYARTQVDLAEPRWEFMNTLFSLSEACMWGQLVDLLDAGRLDPSHGYEDLHRVVKARLDAAHMEGKLKREIVTDPERFVEVDPDLALALMDLRHAGKKLAVVTNSEWDYTRSMMSFILDRFLPRGQTWRDLFDLVIVSARKPDFFAGRSPAFEVVGDDGLLRPVAGELAFGRAYVGGNAGLVEELMGCAGERILYVGDHVYADVHVSKDVLRWRTCLVARELEVELRELAGFAADQALLDELMTEKESLEGEQAALRLQLQRLDHGYGPAPGASRSEAKRRLSALRALSDGLDGRIAPLADRAGRLVNDRWGPLMRAGNDKSHLARQIERYADVYTSRVSNFLGYTPFVYLRSPRGSLPHDPGARRRESR